MKKRQSPDFRSPEVGISAITSNKRKSNGIPRKSFTYTISQLPTTTDPRQGCHYESSCHVNTKSRRGIKHLGISFGSIFLLFSK